MKALPITIPTSVWLIEDATDYGRKFEPRIVREEMIILTPSFWWRLHTNEHGNPYLVQLTVPEGMPFYLSEEEAVAALRDLYEQRIDQFHAALDKLKAA
jgi:hypothetical protein